MQNGDNGGGFFTNWSTLEWIVGATWIAGSALVGFVWRLSLRVALLEHSFEEREESVERRHQENLHVGRNLQQQIMRLTERIDRWVDR